MATIDQWKNKEIKDLNLKKHSTEVKPVKKYTTPGPHLDQIENSGEARAALNEEMPSTQPRKDH